MKYISILLAFALMVICLVYAVLFINNPYKFTENAVSHAFLFMGSFSFSITCFFAYIIDEMGEENDILRSKLYKGTYQMSNSNVKSKVEMVINTLMDIDVDGETMQYILEKIGMEEQMQHQLTSGGIR